jgi:hypothetical protein
VAWLLRDGEVLASCEEPRHGHILRLPLGHPIGAQQLRGPFLGIAGPRGADLCFLDATGRVLCVSSLRPFMPIGVLRPHGMVLCGERGVGQRWNLSEGDRLVVRP